MPIVSAKTLAQTLLLLSYLLCCHFAITRDEPQLQLIAVILLSVGLIVRGLLDNNLVSWGVVICLMLGALAINTLGMLRFVLYLPPILLPLLLWAVFFRSLRPGETPMITAIAQEIRGPLSAELYQYTRTITAIWSAFFLLLTLESALLPSLASAEIWSLFTNCLNYLLIALLFVVEFAYRKRRFRDLEHKSFWQYLGSLSQVDARQF